MRSAFVRSGSNRPGRHLARRLLMIGLGIHGFSGSARAQQFPSTQPNPTAPQHHNLSLEAGSVASGGTSQPTLNQQYRLSNGGLDEVNAMGEKRVSSSQEHLRYSVKNFGVQPDNARLEWYFIAKSVNTAQPGGDFIFDHGSRAVTVAGNQTETQAIDSKKIQAIYERSTTLTSGQGSTLTSAHASQHGAIPAGWMMKLTADGQVIAAQASTQHYEDLVRDEAKLKEFLAHRPAADTGTAGKPKH